MGLKVLITRGLKKVPILRGVLINMGVIREGHFKGRLMKDEPQGRGACQWRGAYHR